MRLFLTLLTLSSLAAASPAPSVEIERENQLVEFLNSRPASAADNETALQRQKRLRRIARAVVEVAAEEQTRKWLPRTAATAAVLTIWYYESRFSRTVHAGGLTQWGSDRGKAKCMGQLHAGLWLPEAQWASLVGTDLESTKRCARATLTRFRMAAGACGWRWGSAKGWAGAFRNYAGASCDKPIPTEKKRVNLALKLAYWLK